MAIDINLTSQVSQSITNGVTDKAPSEDAVYDALALKQDSIGYTAEDTSNKSSSYTASSTTTYANTKALVDGLASVSIDRKDISYFRKTGTTTYERWYSTNFTNAALTTNPSLAKDVIRGIPFIVSKTTTLDRIGMEITGAGTAASVLRLGIYDDVNGVPTNLILDAGTIAADSATAQTIAISQVLTPGLYYLTFVHNSAATITVRAHFAYTHPQVCGFNATWSSLQNAGAIGATFTYGTLKSTFPTSGISHITGSVVPAIFVRLSA